MIEGLRSILLSPVARDQSSALVIEATRCDAAFSALPYFDLPLSDQLTAFSLLETNYAMYYLIHLRGCCLFLLRGLPKQIGGGNGRDRIARSKHQESPGAQNRQQHRNGRRPGK